MTDRVCLNRSRRDVLLGGAATLLTLSRPAARGNEGASISARQALPELARQFLQDLRSPQVDDFLRSWPVAPVRRPVVPSTVPVLRWLPSALARAPVVAEPLVRGLLEASDVLAWRRSYTSSAVGDHFLDNYGWCELVGLTGERASDQLACGCLVLGPDTLYPRHRHEAQEIYVPLSGSASWGRGEGDWREAAPGAVIHHMSGEAHAMRTSLMPLLALYLWRSANLDQKSQLDP